MGVIIPEGVEALIANSGTQELPTRTLALSLLAGFCLMLLVEQLGSSTHDGHSHARAPPDTPWLPTTPRSSASPAVEFDVELAQLESEQGTPLASAAPAAPRSAYTLTTGLVIHGLADGFALGVSAFPSGNDSSGLSELSLVVFMALAVHKAPTALAFTISLLSTSLPRAECQKHLLVFSSSTPLGAMLAFAILYLTGLGDRSRVGAALLVSGGSFLYVATVLQPVDRTAGEGGDKKKSGDLAYSCCLWGAFPP